MDATFIITINDQFKSMNLYIFNNSSLAATYGVGTYLRELIDAIRQDNINICVVNLLSDSPKILKEEINGIKYWYFPSPKLQPYSVDKKKKIALYYRNVVYLLQLYIKDKNNLIFHFNYNLEDHIIRELKQVFNCTIITVVHYLEWSLELSGNVAYFRKLLVRQENEHDKKLSGLLNESFRKEKAFFEIVDHIICLSKHTRQILLNDYQIVPDKVSVIYNGLADSRQTSNKQMLRQKYHIPDMPIFLFAGRLDEIKGLMYAIRSFKKIVSLGQPCHFIIAGDGDFSNNLKECEDIWMHVTWTGCVSKDKLFDLYSIADTGIMPSFYESFGFVAVEMMMHGLPIIATMTSGLSEVVDESCGLQIPVIAYSEKVEIDTDLLAEKMLYLLQHPDERIRMGINARKRYEKHFSGEVFRENMLDF